MCRSKKGKKRKQRSWDEELPSHQAMNKQARDLFQEAVRHSATPSSPLDEVEGPFSEGRRIEMGEQMGGITAKVFDRNYRKADQYTDELLSTSTVRSMLEGIIKANGISDLSDAKLDELTSLFNQISKVRITTQYSGFSRDPAVYSDARMQHPTAGNEGIFGATAGTGSLHSALDRQRKDYALGEMRDAMQVPDYTLEDVVYAGLRAAIRYTLNRFTAPASASDIRPFLAAGVDEQTIRDQGRARRSMKDLYEEFNGELEQGTDSSPGRVYGDRSSDAKPSPRRIWPDEEERSVPSLELSSPAQTFPPEAEPPASILDQPSLQTFPASAEPTATLSDLPSVPQTIPGSSTSMEAQMSEASEMAEAAEASEAAEAIEIPF